MDRLDKLPRYSVTQIDPNVLVGTLTTTRFGKEEWVADDWLGFLVIGERFVIGLWHADADLWKFSPKDNRELEEVQVGHDLVVFDFYCGQRAQLVLNNRFRWVESQYDEGDHEHCAICWQTIGEGGQASAYCNEDRTWICNDCYEMHVVDRSLDFLPNV